MKFDFLCESKSHFKIQVVKIEKKSNFAAGKRFRSSVG